MITLGSERVKHCLFLSAQAATTLAKQLLQLRKQKNKNLNVQSRVAAVGYQTQAMHSNMKMAGAMATASKVHAETGSVSHEKDKGSMHVLYH